MNCSTDGSNVTQGRSRVTWRQNTSPLTTTTTSKALKTVQRTSHHQVKEEHINKMILKQKHAEYFKQATIRCSEEKKKEKGMSAASVAKLYNEECGSNISAPSIL